MLDQNILQTPTESLKTPTQIMEKIYIPSFYSLEEIEKILAELCAAGFDTSGAVVEDSFTAFLSTLRPHDTAAVYSLDCFASMIDLLSAARSVTLRSFRQPWFSIPPTDIGQYLINLHDMAVEIHTERTNRGLRKARQSGKTLGRTPTTTTNAKLQNEQIEQIERMTKEQKISVSQACAAVGMARHTYYRIKK